MKKLPKGEKKIFVFFLISFTFSLSPYAKKQNHLLFPLFFSPEIGKPQGKTSHKNFFFFLTFFHPTAPREQKNYHLPFFFPNSDLKCPKLTLTVRKFHFFQITFFPPVITPTYTPTQTNSVFPTHNA